MDCDLLAARINNLRDLCWREVGVSRSNKGMLEASNRIKNDLILLDDHPLIQVLYNQVKQKSYRFDANTRRDINLVIDLHNRLLTSSLLLEACLFRKESRGGHFRVDAPHSLPQWQCHSSQQLGRKIATRTIRN